MPLQHHKSPRPRSALMLARFLEGEFRIDLIICPSQSRSDTLFLYGTSCLPAPSAYCPRTRNEMTPNAYQLGRRLVVVSDPVPLHLVNPTLRSLYRTPCSHGLYRFNHPPLQR